jgi:hypothetical protein
MARGLRRRGDGLDVEVEAWAFTLDGKLYPLALLEEKLPPLASRFQPFATGGFGYLNLSLDGPPDLEDWDFIGRLGGGLDVYLTRNIVISVDTTYVIPVSDDFDELDYFSVGWGVMFRF